MIQPGTSPSMDDIIMAIEERLEKLAKKDFSDVPWMRPGITLEILLARVYIMCNSAETVESIERVYIGRTKRCGTTSPFIDLRIK